jgi:predicted phage tail protein
MVPEPRGVIPVWIALYLIAAVVVAFLTWHMSHYIQSIEGPTDAGRRVCSLLAGVGWPIVLVGVLQMLAIHLVTRRLRRAPADALAVPVLASDLARF